MALLATFAGLLAPASPASAGPLFTAVCGESHITSDDPIVYPGKNNAAHLHEFSGAFSTNESSTWSSLRASGSTCNQAGDTAAYWTPAVYTAGGRHIRKRATFAYYTNGAKDNYAAIKPFPAGLKMIADLSKSFTVQDSSSTGFRCDGDQDSRPTPYNCPDGKGFQIRILFPDCWDGKNLDSPDHRSHMAYAANDVCPSTHPVPVPRLQLKSTYEATADLSGLKLAPEAGSTTYRTIDTYHADFFNAWDQAKLTDLVRQCINDGEGSPDTLPCEIPGNGIGPDNPSYPNPTLPSGSTTSPPPPPPPPPPPAPAPPPPPPTTTSGCDAAVSADGPVWCSSTLRTYNGTTKTVLPDLSANLGDFTLEARIATTTFDTTRWAFGAQLGSEKIGLMMKPGMLLGYSTTDADVQPAFSTTATNVRRHVALVRQGFIYRLYVDGILRSTSEVNPGCSSTGLCPLPGTFNPGSWALGARPEDGAYGWKGTVEDAAFYNKAIGATRISAHSSGG